MPTEPTAPLWALLIEGPDEMHAAPSREAAEATAARMNGYQALQRAGVVSKAVPWPYAPEIHVAHLKLWTGMK